MRNILNILEKILYIKFFCCILRNHVFPIEKESIYRIFGKYVCIFLNANRSVSKGWSSC